MTTKIVMMDPTFEVISNTECTSSYAAGCMRIWLLTVRERWVEVLEKSLPEPMSSLAAGILLGVKGQMPKDFYTALVNTGTLHIVAASGYNVTIVAGVIMSMLNGLVGRTLGVGFGIFGIFLYVFVAGAGASVVRAGIMGSLTLVAFYFGRPTEAKRLLYIAAGIMLFLDPAMIFDIGFQLSFLATFGLLYLEPLFKKLPRQALLAEYLYPTLAASIATLPVIIYQFGRVSYISPLVNMMVLPVVPLIMGLSAVVIGVGVIFPGIGQIIAWTLYPLLWYMVEVIMWGG
jgi:competence protein ComEC